MRIQLILFTKVFVDMIILSRRLPFGELSAESMHPPLPRSVRRISLRHWKLPPVTRGIMFQKILMLNTLRNQHIIDPVDDVSRIVSDAVGVQAQYLNNALFAISIRHKNIDLELDTDVIRKIWSFRGTLHLHVAADITSVVSILRNEWHIRWGKYMASIFSDDMRKQMQKQTCQLIAAGFCNRQMLRDECLRLGYAAHVVDSAFSSWGGILKDLNYDGRIYFSKYDKLDFSLSGNNLLEDVFCSAFGSAIAKRYFSFYGPATLADFCYWAGISQSLGKQWFQDIEKNLSFLTDEKNNKYYYAGELAENTAELPKCVFIGGFDPLMLAYKNKERWLKAEHHNKIFSKNGFVRNVILFDGMAEAIWKMDKGVLKITLLEPTGKKQNIVSKYIASSNILDCKRIEYSD